MTMDSKIKPLTAIQSLTAIAMTLPGIQNACADTQILTPKTDFQYIYYDEGKKRYRIDNYRALLEMPLSNRSDLSIEFTRDVQAGATPYGNAIKSFFTADPSDFTKLVSYRTKASVQEDRNAVDVRGRYFAENFTVALTGNVSEEHDFSSQGGSIKLIKDFNKKNTEVSLGYGFINNTIKATKQASIFFTQRRPKGHYTAQLVNLTLEQVITDKNYIQQIFEFGHDRGFLHDPYKLVFVYGDPTRVHPAPIGFYFDFLKLPGDPDPNNGIGLILDTRPSHKSSFISNTKFVQYIQCWDSSIHLAYRFIHNDWKINSHTVTIDYYQPFWENYEAYLGLRYYTQSSAKFYHIFFHSGNYTSKLDTKKLGKYASEDNRLAKFGDITFQGSVSMRFLKNRSGKITAIGGVIDRKNRYYAGHLAKTPDPANNYTTFYVGLQLTFDM